MTNTDTIAPLEARHFWFRGRDLLFRELLRRHAPDASSILDLGCGTGRFAAALHASGLRVIAVDIETPPSLPDGPELLRASAERLPLRDRTIDVAFARDVLEHVADDAAALREAARVLRPGGCLIAAVPGWPSLWSERDVRAHHERRYRRRELVAAVEHAGFAIADVRGYQLALLPAFALSRLLARRAPRSQLRREERLSGPVNSVLAAINRFEVSASMATGLRPPTGSTHVVVAVRG